MISHFNSTKKASIYFPLFFGGVYTILNFFSVLKTTCNHVFHTGYDLIVFRQKVVNSILNFLQPLQDWFHKRILSCKCRIP